MIQAATEDSNGDLQGLVQQNRWAEACHLYERLLPRAEKQQSDQKLHYAIALIRSGRMSSGVNLLDDEMAALPQARLALRRYAVPALVEQKRFDSAITILGLLLKVDPSSVEDLRLRASLLGRTRQFPAAIQDARRLIELHPSDLKGHTAYLQLLLQNDEVDEAGRHASSLAKVATDDPRLTSIGLLALGRAQMTDRAAALAETAETIWTRNADVMFAVTRAYVEAGLPERAIRAGERCLACGQDNAELRRALGYAYRESLRSDRLERVIEHLGEAVRQLPDDANARVVLGEALMRSSRPADAVTQLTLACKRLPDNANARALLARALKQNGQAGDAAREFRRLLDLQPQSQRWHRFAAGALSQAGHTEEAQSLFDSFTARRAEALPHSFEEGLAALWDQVDEANIPKARLDWAWQLRRDAGGDRTQWERAARWGHLADHYMLDWLECRDELAHEAMTRLADLSAIERSFAAVDTSRGMILASAHVGAMYAGPLALELLDVRSKWLASTPSVARTSYARSLISTSDQSGTEVARQVLSSLNTGSAVVIAVDGAINVAAPRIEFEGQEVTYSSFASRMAHRLNIPSMFVAPFWKSGKIHFELQLLPDPTPGESAEQHAKRWQAAFLLHLREFLGGAPENLRLSGGLWRHIRPVRGARD